MTATADNALHMTGAQRIGQCGASDRRLVFTGHLVHAAKASGVLGLGGVEETEALDEPDLHYVIPLGCGRGQVTGVLVVVECRRHCAERKEPIFKAETALIGKIAAAHFIHVVTWY